MTRLRLHHRQESVQEMPLRSDSAKKRHFGVPILLEPMAIRCEMAIFTPAAPPAICPAVSSTSRPINGSEVDRFLGSTSLPLGQQRPGRR